MQIYFVFIFNDIWKIISGRTEKQAQRDALQQGRTPPTFSRTPSRRQPRRNFEENGALKNLDNTSKYLKQEIKSISIPQPAQM